MAAQFMLLMLGAFTAKEHMTIVMIAPVAGACLMASYRNNSPRFDVLDMFWLLIMLFFVVGPLQSLTNNTTSLFAMKKFVVYRDAEIMKAFAAMYIGVFAALTFLPPSQHQKSGGDIAVDERLLLAGVVGLFILVVLSSGGFGNLLASRYDKDDSGVALLLTIFQGMHIAATALLIGSLVRKRIGAMEIAIGGFTLLLLLIVFNPFNTARFFLISAWLPIMFILFPPLLKPLAFYGTTIFSLLVLMPILSVTTRFGSSFSQIDKTADNATLSHLPYIDVFDVLLHAVRYVNLNGFAYGRNLEAIFLFFVPRSIWTGKPLVSGLLIGNDLYLDRSIGTPNLSMDIIGDFYLDFGLIGVAVGSIALSYFFGKFLLHYRTIRGLPILTYLMIAAFPVMVRGTVGAVIPLFMSILLGYWIVLRLTANQTIRL